MTFFPDALFKQSHKTFGIISCYSQDVRRKKMGILVKAHIAKALYSESSSTEIVVKLIVT